MEARTGFEATGTAPNTPVTSMVTGHFLKNLLPRETGLLEDTRGYAAFFKAMSMCFIAGYIHGGLKARG
jgi:hypothetical protein